VEPSSNLYNQSFLIGQQGSPLGMKKFGMNKGGFSNSGKLLPSNDQFNDGGNKKSNFMIQQRTAMGGSGDLFPKSPKRYNDMVYHNMSATFKGQGSGKLKQGSNLEMNQTLEPTETHRQSSLKKVLPKHKNVK